MLVVKRPYVRPMLAFESYQLDAAIAVHCKVPIGNTTYQCSVNLSGESIGWWTTGGEFFNYQNCQTDLVGTGENNESVCYHGPHSTFNIYDIFLNS